jgi:hypothetical protein
MMTMPPANLPRSAGLSLADAWTPLAGYAYVKPNRLGATPFDICPDERQPFCAARADAALSCACVIPALQ